MLEDRFITWLSQIFGAQQFLLGIFDLGVWGDERQLHDCELNGWSQHFNLFTKDGVVGMKYRKRTFYTDKQKSEMCDRLLCGQSILPIGAMLPLG